MFRLLRKSEAGQVAFCERCGSTCDRSCRADAIRDEQWRVFTRYGWRVV